MPSDRCQKPSIARLSSLKNALHFSAGVVQWQNVSLPRRRPTVQIRSPAPMKETLNYLSFHFEPDVALGDFFNSQEADFATLNIKKDNILLGFAEMVIVPERKNFRYIYLKYLYIKPQYRSQGYGAILLSEVEALAQKFNVDLIRGDLDMEKTTLEKRIRFFKKAGYSFVRHHSHEAIDVYKKINPKSPLDKYLAKSFKLGNSYHA